MRILHVADLHARWDWYDWLARQSSEFDLVVIAGDLVDMLDDRTLPEQTRRVSGWVRAFPGKLLICSGNHDVFLEQSIDASVTSPRWIQDLASDRVVVDGASVQCGPLRFEVVPWGGVPTLRVPTDIVIAHCPPSGGKTALTHDDPVGFGDLELADVLTQAQHSPWLILGGHNHAPRRWYAQVPGTRCWSLVPGCRPDVDVPLHLIVDTDKMRAERVRPDLREVLAIRR